MANAIDNLSFNTSATISGSTGGIAKRIGRFVWVSGYFKTTWYGTDGSIVEIPDSIPAPTLITFFSCGAMSSDMITGYMLPGEKIIKFNFGSAPSNLVYFHFVYPID